MVTAVYRRRLNEETRMFLSVYRHLCNFTASFPSAILTEKTDNYIRSSRLAKTQVPIMECLTFSEELIMQANRKYKWFPWRQRCRRIRYMSGQNQVRATYQYCSYKKHIEVWYFVMKIYDLTSVHKNVQEEGKSCGKAFFYIQIHMHRRQTVWGWEFILAPPSPPFLQAYWKSEQKIFLLVKAPPPPHFCRARAIATFADQ